MTLQALQPLRSPSHVAATNVAVHLPWSRVRCGLAPRPCLATCAAVKRGAAVALDDPAGSGSTSSSTPPNKSKPTTDTPSSSAPADPNPTSKRQRQQQGEGRRPTTAHANSSSVNKRQSKPAADSAAGGARPSSGRKEVADRQQLSKERPARAAGQGSRPNTDKARKQPAADVQRNGKGRLVKAAAAGAAVAAAAAATVAEAPVAGSSSPAETSAGPSSPLPHLAPPRPAAPPVVYVFPSRGVDVHSADSQFVSDLRRRAQQTNNSVLVEVADSLAAQLEEGRKQGQMTINPGPTSPSSPSLPTAAPAAETEEAGAEEQEEEPEEEQSPVSALDVYVPEVEVVSEIVNTLLGVLLPRKAYYGTRARALASMSIQDVKTSCKQWVEVCGLEYARMFIYREPRLLSLPAVSLPTSLEAVSSCLALTPAQSIDWVLRNTSLLASGGLTQARLSTCMSEMSEVMLSDPQKVVAIARRHTMLLTFSPGSIQRRFDVIADLLPVQRARLASACVAQPRLLTNSPSRVASTLVQLALLTGCSLRDASVMLAAQPQLMGIAVDRLATRWMRLTKLASRYAVWEQQLLGLPPASVARCLQVTDKVMDRLAFVLNYNLQELSCAQDMKRVLTMSTGAFKTQLVLESHQLKKWSGKPREEITPAQA